MVDFKVICCAPLALCLPLLAQQERIYETPDITKVPTLYVVPYAHLDTQWRLDATDDQRIPVEDVEGELRIHRKYPHYVFNWTGSNRWRLMKEYFPTTMRG